MGTGAKVGWVYKKEGIVAKWKRYWFEIDGMKLNFYDNETNRPHIRMGQVRMDDCSAVTQPSSGDASPCDIDVVTRDDTHHLRCESEADVAGWMEALGSLCGGDSASVAQRNQRMQANGTASTGKMLKRPWTSDEDSKLFELVGKYGPKKWSFIAAHIPGRVGKQCRERWQNHLNPQVARRTKTTELC